jgi:hypothetical protein
MCWVLPVQPLFARRTSNCCPSPYIPPQISPRSLERDFWEGFSQRVWHWQDSLTSGCTVALLPLMWTRTPGMGLGISYALVYCLKAFHVAALWRAHKATGQGSQLCAAPGSWVRARAYDCCAGDYR